ncbi:protein phosphatase 2C domain-containing protein [Laceyella tengchongensis]
MTNIRLHSISNPNPDKNKNEDLVSSFQNVYWVLDGASVPNGLMVPSKIDTKWYVEQLDKGIKKALTSFTEPYQLKEVLHYAIQYVLDHSNLREYRSVANFVLPSSTVAMVKINNKQMEYLVLGDSYIVTDISDSIRCFTDNRLENVGVEMRSEINHLLQSGNGYHSDSINNIKMNLVKLEVSSRNQKDGYWIASEKPDAAYHAMTGTLEIKTKGKHVLLMTDGFARAVTTLDLFKSWGELLKFVNNYGLDKCLELIRSKESADPQGQTYPRFKQYDDASALLISIN